MLSGFLAICLACFLHAKLKDFCSVVRQSIIVHLEQRWEISGPGAGSCPLDLYLTLWNFSRSHSLFQSTAQTGPALVLSWELLSGWNIFLSSGHTSCLAGWGTERCVRKTLPFVWLGCTLLYKGKSHTPAAAHLILLIGWKVAGGINFLPPQEGNFGRKL